MNSDNLGLDPTIKTPKFHIGDINTGGGPLGLDSIINDQRRINIFHGPVTFNSVGIDTPVPVDPTADSVPVKFHPKLPTPSLFLGRELEVKELSDSLLASDSKIILLYGVGGFGKSTLAAHIARQLADQVFTTIIWSSASGSTAWSLTSMLRDFTVVIPAIGKYPTEQQQEAAVLTYVQNHPTLVICDNLEVLVDNLAEQERLKTFINSIDPQKGSRVLLTSRREDKWLHELLVSFGGKSILVQGLDESASVQLLRQLAQQKQLASLLEASDTDLVPFVQAVFYNPLLIAFLVAEGDYVRIKRIVARLPQNIREVREKLLADAFARLQQVPGALNLVQQMSVFTPSADYAALEYVCKHIFSDDVGCDAAFNAAKSSALLSYDITPDGTSRYYLHPFVTSYLKDNPNLCADRIVLATAHFWHANYFLQFAFEHQAITEYDLLASEWENIFVAWDWAVAQYNIVKEKMVGGKAEKFARIMAEIVMGFGVALRDFVLLRGLWGDGERLLGWSVQAAPEIGQQEGISLLLHAWAVLIERRGEPDIARKLYIMGLELDQKQGNKVREASALHTIALLDWQAGFTAKARSGFEKSLALSQEIGDIEGQIGPLHSLTVLDVQVGDLSSVRRRYAMCLRLARKAGSVRDEAATWHALGQLDQQLGDMLMARRHYEASLEISHQIGDVLAETQVLHNLAWLDGQLGNTGDAKKGYEKSLQLAHWIGDLGSEAATLHQLACIEDAAGNSDKAQTLYETSLQFKRQLNDVRGVAFTQIMLGQLLYRKGSYTLAITKLRAAVSAFERVGMTRQLADARIALEACKHEILEELRIMFEQEPQLLANLRAAGRAEDAADLEALIVQLTTEDTPSDLFV